MNIERALHRRNLSTAFVLSSGWKPEHQAQLAELVVEEFVQPQDDALDHDAVTCECASCVSYMDNLLADAKMEARRERR